MTRQDICSVDIEGLSKKNLKALVKVARTEWGEPIDLRSATEGAMCDYLRLYRQWKLDQEATEEPAATTSENEAEATIIAGVEEPVEVCEACGNDINEDEATVIARVEEAVAPEPAELEIPESFNAIASRTIDILLQFGSGYRSIINQAWLQGILKDASWRATIPGSVTEKLLLSDPIFYGLAGIGIAHDSIALFERVAKTPEEFRDIPEDATPSADFYRNLGLLLGVDKIAQIAAYHSIRANLNYLQQRLGISSLEPRTAGIRDKLFEYWDYNDQMALLDSDRLTLKAQTGKIAAYFQSLTSDYQLFREMDDESLEPLPEDFDLQAMMSHAFGCDYCWLHAESFEWQPYSDGYIGHHVQRLNPDKISLYLDSWNGSEYVSFLRLVAHHPDPARRPWEAS